MQPTDPTLCEICRAVAATASSLKILTTKHGILLCRGVRPTSGNSQCKLREISWKCIDDYNEQRRTEGSLSNVLTDSDPKVWLRAWNGGRAEGKQWFDIDQLSLEYQNSPDVNSSSFAPLRDFEVYTSPNDPAARWISTRNVELDLGSEDAFQCILNWVNRCESNHKGCFGPQMKALPTRVIDVGPPDGSRDPKLHISNGEIYHYLTLSYCWGGPQPVTLTMDNLNERAQSISFDSLPRTIQDAVAVTRKLGMRYIWIDALCIIQDSVEDKAKELKRMAHIYRDGLLTISAASAAGCHEGFLELRQSPQSEIQPFTLIYGSPDGGSDGGQIYLRELKRYNAFDDPANERAWTLQERLLSPRVVVYSRNQLRWQCQTSNLSNGGVSRNFLDSGSERLDPAFFNDGNGSLSLLEFTYSWIDTVIDYTRRSLTYPEDKLIAISAIASEFRNMKTGGNYLAGMWRNSLSMELMWMVEASGSRRMLRPRPLSYRSPSWSWASVDGSITFGGTWRDWPEKETMFATILKCEVTQASEEVPTGGVINGVLEIRGQLKWAKVILGNDDLLDTDTDDTVIGKVYMDANEENYGDVCCLRLQDARGIILKPLSPQAKEWRRIGYCEIRTEKGWMHTKWFDDCEPEVIIIK